MHKRIVFTAVLTMALATCVYAQMGKDKGSRPSPPANASCKFADGKMMTTDYSSPRMKGRKIFGDLVPNGEPWRTGANEATTLVTDANLTIGGKSVPAGSYTLFTIPNTDKWTLIISKATGEWGIPYPEGKDLLRADMSVTKLASPMENFTISYKTSGSACTLQLAWESTQASIDIAEKK